MKNNSRQIMKAYEKRKRTHLIISLMIDLFGMASYLIPFLGEIADVIYGPISGIAIFLMYKQNLGAGILGGLFGAGEEMLLGDFIPTATIMWIYTYKFREKKAIHSYIEENKWKYEN